MNLSFAGCGFLGIYHVGVAVCFRKYAPHLLLDKISGASAGAIAACCLICDLPIGGLTSDVLRLATEARSRSLGPFSPSFNIQNLLLEGLEKFLPNDAHIRVSGKLHVSLTRVYDGKNVIVSQFNSREELLQALLASSFVPVFSGIIPPKFQGVRYADGGFSNNLPALDENTITVSPFCGESDICPRDNSSQLFHINVANTSIELSRLNIYRMTRILFPPKPELLSDLCKQGFDDALRFLHRNNLISCTRCLAVQSTFVVAESLDECFEYDPECNECKMHQEEALLSNMPDTVLTVFQEAIDSANKGLVNWIFKHRGMKLLSVLSLPYTLPADIVYATFTNIIGTTIETHTLEYKVIGNALVTTRGPCQHLKKQKRVMSAAPSMGNSLWDVSKFFLDQFSYLLSGVSSNRQQQQTAKISCQLAYTEYGGSGSNIDIQTQNKMNLNLTLNLNEEQNVDKKSITNRIFSRRKSSITISRSDTGNEDTFENILQVTSQHDAIMAYYFMDENNKVKVTEIFDVTESDSSAALSQQEREVNTRLEFDDDWNESAWTTQQAVEKPMLNNDNSSITDYTLDEIIDKETSNIFCNPESEWLASTEIETEDELMALEDDNSDSRPESDQVTYTENLYKKPFKVPSFNYEELDI